MADRIPNTVSDRQMAELRRKAETAAPCGCSQDAARKRLAANRQRNKASQS